VPPVIWLQLAIGTEVVATSALKVWSGIGTAAIAVIGIVFFEETLGWVGIAGITLIVLGVVLLNVSGAHN